MSMTNEAEARIPWRMRAFVTIADAALIVGRSTSWIRDMLTAGALEARLINGRGVALITVSSLARLVDRAEPLPREALSQPRPCGSKPKLRLAVDNT
jgi:hypothetical protein